MTAADTAHALGDARREGRGWRSRCPLHGGRTLTLRDGDGGRFWCFGGCDPPKELGISERSVNRDDRRGAPFVFIGGVKYRPAKRYAAFIMGRIQVRQRPPHKRAHRRRRG